MIRYIGDNQPENLEKYIPILIGYKCCTISAITAITYFITTIYLLCCPWEKNWVSYCICNVGLLCMQQSI